MAIGNLKIENYVPVVKLNKGIYTAQTFKMKAGTTCTLPAATTIGGSSVAALTTITSTSANSLTVGRQGTTAPAFNVDSSTASQAAGLNVVGAVAAGTVAVAAISSGAAANLSIDAKGSGTIAIAGTSTGVVSIGNATSKVNFAITGIADGTGSTGTLLKVGGTGRPQTTAQSGWLPVQVAGVAAWIPYWV
jgi:hypothetical protein